jgi:hypothetical protein
MNGVTRPKYCGGLIAAALGEIRGRHSERSEESIQSDQMGHRYHK